MKQFVLFIFGIFFTILSYSIGGDFDKYQLMNKIICTPNILKTMNTDTISINFHFRKEMMDSIFITKTINYLEEKFSNYHFINYDTVLIRYEKGSIKGFKHQIMHMNELGDIFCFIFVKTINEDWELVAFGDYEVWDPYPKCQDD